MMTMRCSMRNGYILAINPRNEDESVRYETEDWMLGLTKQQIIEKMHVETSLDMHDDIEFVGMYWESKPDRNPHQDMVAEFMDKHDFPCGESMDDYRNAQLSELLFDFADQLKSMQQQLKHNYCDNLRGARAQLVLEEVGELMEALAYRNRKQVADAVGDIEYVVLGLAESFGINSEKVFCEVHDSNMSKDVGGHKPTGGHKPELKDV